MFIFRSGRARRFYPYRNETKEYPLSRYRTQVLEEEGDKLNIGFIGAGKVGFTLGRYIKESAAGKDDRIKVKGYCSLHRESSQDAAHFTDSIAYDDVKTLTDECDMIFITVPDGKIRDIWGEISGYDLNGKLICHCSGAMSSEDAFEGIEDTGAFGYSVHPLFAVSDRYETYRELTGVFFTLEGHGKNALKAGADASMEKITGLLDMAGNPYRIISPGSKTRYHLSAAVASNLVCGLIDMSIDLMEDCGFTGEEAVGALAPILRGNMAHIAQDGPERSLTGPIERNDMNTVGKHLECFEDPSEREIYRLLSGRLVEMAQHRHPDRDYAGMRKMLGKEGRR